jgi:hypothetical protein
MSKTATVIKSKKELKKEAKKALLSAAPVLAKKEKSQKKGTFLSL